MSRRDRKVTESAGMHPRLDPNLTSDGTENPDAITPVNEGNIAGRNEDMASCGTQGQQARKELQDLLEEVEGRHFMKTHLLEMINMTVKLAMDADQMRKQTDTLSKILDEQQKALQQFQVIHKQTVKEFKELCKQHLENLQTTNMCPLKALVEEAEKQMDILKGTVDTEMEEEGGDDE